MEPRDYITIGSLLVAILAWLANLAKMYYDSKERRAHFRQATYAKLLEAFTETDLALRNFANHLRLIPSKEADMDSYSNKTLELSKPLLAAYVKWSLFLPKSVSDKLLVFFKQTTVLVEMTKQTKTSDPVKILHDFETAYNDVINAMRMYLGVDALSDDITSIVSGQNDLMIALEKLSFQAKQTSD